MSMARILLVEDYDDSRIMLRRLLELEGFVVTEAVSGIEALAKLQSGSFDCMVLDLRLPDIDGLHVLETVRGDTEMSGIPVVVVSAQDDEATRQAVRKAGCSGFLSKPVDIDRLAESLRRLTNAR